MCERYLHFSDLHWIVSCGGVRKVFTCDVMRFLSVLRLEEAGYSAIDSLSWDEEVRLSLEVSCIFFHFLEVGEH